jgi:hypothetical protein
VGGTKFDAEKRGWIETGVHAGQYSYLTLYLSAYLKVLERDGNTGMAVVQDPLCQRLQHTARSQLRIQV